MEFLKKKSETCEKVIDWIRIFEKDTGKRVQHIRLDNSGENVKLREKVNEYPDLKIKFEYTAPHTPQQNGKIERKFATLYGKVRSMLNAAQLSEMLRRGLWAHCANKAAQLENIIV